MHEGVDLLNQQSKLVIQEVNKLKGWKDVWRTEQEALSKFETAMKLKRDSKREESEGHGADDEAMKERMEQFA